MPRHPVSAFCWVYSRLTSLVVGGPCPYSSDGGHPDSREGAFGCHLWDVSEKYGSRRT